MPMAYRQLRPWIVWLVASLFYLIEYLLRVDPSVFLSSSPQLLPFTAFQIACFSSIFLLAYLVMQIPAGMLLDVFGPRSMLLISMAVAMFSCVWLASATEIRAMLCARALLGAAAAFAFLGALKLAVHWIPTRQLSVVIGLTLSVGMLGGVAAQWVTVGTPTGLSWVEYFYFLAMVIAVLWISGYWLIADAPPTLLSRRVPDQAMVVFSDQIGIVLRNARLWQIGIYCALLFIPIGVFTEMWGPDYLLVVGGVQLSTALLCTSFSLLGVAVGGPVLAMLCFQWRCYHHCMRLCPLLGMAFLSYLLYVPIHSVYLLAMSLFCVGLASSAVVLGYARAIQKVSQPLVGMTVAFINCLVSLGIAVVQPWVGWLIDHFSIQPLTARSVFQSANYHAALHILPLSYLMAALLAGYLARSSKH